MSVVRVDDLTVRVTCKVCGWSQIESPGDALHPKPPVPLDDTIKRKLVRYWTDPNARGLAASYCPRCTERERDRLYPL